ncbi:general stress protein [Pseudactinotalea terrae]|uniref:general stress protein n=1 Tax=Pseudactinotalea terrae TaxID=1743262 RepID=UPI0012E27A44|nr:general stress protein [Pseudactinotalea terrae]
MSFMQTPRDPRLGNQPRGEEIAAYDTYLQAQRTVDFLSDSEFPVQKVTIVGTDLKMVERITGRRTYMHAALQGAASGAWLGVFLGLMFLLLSPGATLVGIFIPALLIGAGFGMLWGVVGHALTGGRRDFSSTSQVMASRFAVLCLAESADEARRLLATMPADGAAPVADDREA